MLAATASGNPAYVYSGWLMGYIYLGNALYSQDPEGYWDIRETLPEEAQLVSGDEVLTSGRGEIFPPACRWAGWRGSFLTPPAKPATPLWSPR